MLIDNKGYTVLDFARKYSPNLVPILEQEINKPKIPLDHNNNVNAKGKNDVDIEKEIRTFFSVWSAFAFHNMH